MQQQRAGSDPLPLNNDAIFVHLRGLRADYPGMQVLTKLVQLDETVVVVRVNVVLPDGGSASALGSADATRDHAVEEAETRALGRALIALGLDAGVTGTTETAAPAPVIPAAPSVTVVAPHAHRVETNGRQHEAEVPAPLEDVQSDEVTPDVDEDPPLEDYSWTSFWQWARKLGYQNKIAVEEVIGLSITSLNPAQVRNLLREKTGAE